MRWNRMQELILLFSVLQCRLLSEALLEDSFLSLLLSQAKVISGHHRQCRIWQAVMCSWNHLSKWCSNLEG